MKRKLLVVIVITVAFVNMAMASVFLFHEIFNLTSSNSAVYFLRGKTGGVEVKRDLFIEDADRMMFMVDASNVFNYLMKGMAIARQNPVLELTWNEGEGVGEVKQFRTDGSVLSLCFARSSDHTGKPMGLFLGGDLPYGDASRAPTQDTSGFGYFDGQDWHHIWCASNEAFKLSGLRRNFVPSDWKYLGSKVLKDTKDEVILQSNHELDIGEKRIMMQRLISFRAGDDYFVLKIKLTNAGRKAVSYGYSWGDEPWVGHYGASKGDIGWYDGGLVKTEQLISPSRHRYVGFWDYGNDLAGEGRDFSGYANFVEWFSATPSLVFFSNAIDRCCDESLPLSSETDRVVNIVWLNQLLMPSESRTYTLAIGLARPDPENGMPVKPVTIVD
jgi:hypothetical protein